MEPDKCHRHIFDKTKLSMDFYNSLIMNYQLCRVQPKPIFLFKVAYDPRMLENTLAYPYLCSLTLGNVSIIRQVPSPFPPYPNRRTFLISPRLSRHRQPGEARRVGKYRERRFMAFRVAKSLIQFAQQSIYQQVASF